MEKRRKTRRRKKRRRGRKGRKTTLMRKTGITLIKPSRPFLYPNLSDDSKIVAKVNLVSSGRNGLKTSCISSSVPEVMFFFKDAENSFKSKCLPRHAT